MATLGLEMTPSSSLDLVAGSLAALHRLFPDVCRVDSVGDFWVKSKEGKKRNKLGI